MRKISNSLMFAGLILCLLQIWLPTYYLSGDGPSHLYNASILHDFWVGKNVDFYSRFYELNKEPNPNWISHIVLAMLMFLFKGVVAEKVLLSGYVLLFLSGGYVLFKRLGNNSHYWPLITFLFVFNRFLVAGFYNFVISIAFFFWFLEVWLSVLEERKKGRIMLFFLLTLLTFFSHPLAFVFGCFTCFALIISYTLADQTKIAREKLKSILGNLLTLTLCLIPCLVLFARFALKEGGVNGLQLHLYQYRFHDLLKTSFLVNYTNIEAVYIKYIGLVTLVLFPIALFWNYKKGFEINKYDGLLVGFLFALFVYKCFPDSILGGGSLILRALFFLFLFIACCISYLLQYPKVLNAIGLLFFGCFIFLSIGRLGRQLAAAEGVTEYISASKYIKPYSVVLPLNFSPHGTDEHGHDIADNMYLYSHASQYMGAEKALIILDNYEAIQGYFPFNWREKINPYSHLGRDEGIEGWPLYALIDEYTKESGVSIDYILMWCYKPEYLQNKHFLEFYNEINRGYHVVYKSATSRSILYQKN